jgi:hypothetical protein
MMPKTITGFVFLMGAMACAVCAAQTPVTSNAPAASAATETDTVPPRTLPSHPEAQSAASKPAAPSKTYGGTSTGYRRVVSNGQELYCRNDVATGSHTERKAVCLTEAQVRIEQLKAEQFMLDMQRRAGSERQLTYIYGNNAGMSSNTR